MTYNIVITTPAEMDIDEIHLYISTVLFAPMAADNLIDELEKHILDLKKMPKRYALVSDERLARLGYRAIPVNNYLIFYIVNEQPATVTIVRVLYGSRDWGNLLLAERK